MSKPIQNISTFVKLSEQLRIELSNRTTIKAFKKGELIHNADRICKHSYFIEKGILRLYLLKDGKEISEFFGSEGEWMNSPKSFMQQVVDNYYIDAIEDCELLILSISDLMFLFDNFPEMEKYARLDMGSTFIHLLERIASIRFTTAKEKYSHFCKVYPKIYHRIPLKMVAAYLGLTPETLSRIRK